MADKVVELCQKMVQIKSYSGEEGDIAAYMRSFFEAEGFDDIVGDDFGNVIAHLKGDRPGKTLVIDGHMDTVPADNESEWLCGPYSGEIRDGRLYGRGSTDMKGPLAAAICGVLEYRDETQGHFPGDIYISCVVHEECFEGCASHSTTSMVNADYVIIAEPSSMTLKIGQKGRAEIQLETFGKAAHSSNPDAGINAVYKMMPLIKAFQELPVIEDARLGKGILELTDIQSAPYPGASVVPEYCKATFDRRMVGGETRESVLAPLQAVLDKAMAEDPQLKAKVSYARGTGLCYTGKELDVERFFPGWCRKEDEPYIQASYKALNEELGNVPISHYYFCTNGSHYGGELNLKCIGFGPSYENMAHILNENIEIDQLQKGVRGYRVLTKALLENVED